MTTRDGKNMEAISQRIAEGAINLRDQLKSGELDGMMADIKAELAKKNACTKHRFKGGKVERYGEKYLCLICGVRIDLREIGSYIRGYVAAGGDANDIWPGWGA